MKYEFAIQKTVLENKKVILTPVVREKKRSWLLGFYENPWQRIVFCEGKYFTLDLPWNPDLTFEECQQRIKGYQDQLEAEKSHNIKTVELDNLEVKEI